MKQNKDNTYPVDVEKAWGILCARLEKDKLLTGETDYSPRRKQKIALQWAAIAAAICAGVIFSVFYFSQEKAQPMVFLQNDENSGALVTTLNDGSTIYLETNASISYPTVFAARQRKVELNGNALFCISKDAERPFVIETGDKITIEVVGTIFAVQSSFGKPFELSVKQGKVNVHSKNSSAAFPVEAGETVQLNSGGLTKWQTSNLQIFNRFTDKMCFKDEKLNNIVHAINTMYGYPAIATEESINNRTLTVTFENDSVETMTKLICLALNLEQINKQDTIFIRQ
jgi:ferric-dicitrate binding protein FerR (iron transport regulator)